MTTNVRDPKAEHRADLLHAKGILKTLDAEGREAAKVEHRRVGCPFGGDPFDWRTVECPVCNPRCIVPDCEETQSGPDTEGLCGWHFKHPPEGHAALFVADDQADGAA